MSNKKSLIADIYPLSPMQEGMLFHTLYAPESGMYLLQTTCLLDGELDAAAFEQAWDRALERHAVLRTAFLWENLEKPVQVVYKKANLGFEVLDWRSLSSEARQEERAKLLAEDRHKGFNPARPPLLRVRLLRHEDNLHELVFSYHHLLLDAWSGAPLLGEVFADYGALRQGEELTLPPRRPYRDYIAWLKSRDLEKAEAFWRAGLKGFEAATPIASDRPARREPSPSDAYSLRRHVLSPEVTAKLQDAARARQVTMNAVVQSAWALLLGRRSGDRDVLYGVVVSGRPTDLPGAESMIGLFINTLPMRVSLADGPSVEGLWRRLRDHQTELQSFEYSPLVTVQGWSDVPRDQTMFESIFIFANYPAQGSEGDIGLEVHRAATEERTNYPLTVDARVEDGRLELMIYYEHQRFDRDNIDRILGHLEVMIGAMAEDPERSALDLPWLSEGERGQLLTDWNPAPTAAAEPATHTLIARFAAQARSTPDAPAVSFGGDTLTYGELAGRARRLAAALRDRGVGPEVLVGLAVERSLDMVVSILGVLGAGGAYLPLDPELPEARLSYIVGDARPALLLTQEGLVERWDGEALGCGVVTVESLIDGAGDESAELDATPVDPLNPAYVIYTSGSTGKPKGTPVSHANALRLFDATDPWFGFGGSDVWTLFHSYAFDFTVWELWGALLYGGRLVVVPGEVVRSPEAFLQLLAEEGVTVLNQTPSAFRHLIAADGETATRVELALRTVVFGGESVDLASLEPWFERRGDQRPRLVNMYGITETTVHVTYRPLERADLAGDARSPIGVPIPDLELHVLDAKLDLLPVGVPGELHVAGAGLARGYLGRPALTAERFVPHPYAKTPGERLYRTGDLGRRQADGGVDYLGRIDHQVKIRGFRIELGEIEAALGEHPALGQAVVSTHLGSAGPMLVGYLVAGGDGEPVSDEALRTFLRQRLPEYMVPSVFVRLESLPLTDTGKLDRKALPAPEGERPDLGIEFVAPGNELERQIAKVWAEVLGVEKVGVNDSFFDLGGHSLAMVTAVGKLRKILARPLSIVDAFRYPTVLQLAAHFAQQTAAPSAAEQREEAASKHQQAKDRRQRLARQRQRPVRTRR